MKPSHLALAIALSSGTAVVARVARLEPNCPNRYLYCGECNGTSCKIAGINYKCKHDTKCVGPEGGDGAICGTFNINLFRLGRDILCPVGLLDVDRYWDWYNNQMVETDD